MLKKYLYSFLIFFGSIILINLLLTIFSYFSLFNSKVISIMYFVLILISLFISSFILGMNSLKKGYLEGLKLGGGIVLIFFLLIIILDKFMVKSLIYYIILILTSILGSMIGINRKKS